MKPRGFAIAMAVIASIQVIAASAQDMAGRWSFGFGGGIQKLISYDKRTGIGLGGEGQLGYRFSNRFGGTLAIGYSTLPFTFVGVTSAGKVGTAPLRTNLIYGNLLFDFELLDKGNFRPYFMVGAGGLNFDGFRVTGATSKNRLNSGSGVLGIGMRYLLNDQTMLNAYGAYHHTTGDAIDTRKGGQDAYLSGRIGLSYVLGGGSSNQPDQDFFAELSPIEDSQEASNFESRLNELESSSQEEDESMQDYVRLKSQLDTITEDIDAKEGEISSLRAAIASKRNNIAKRQNTPPKRPARPAGSFSRAYEEALTSFYMKRYQEAIQKFTALIDQFPNHTLTSNCYYWRGEAEFGAGNYQAAIDEFNKVLEFSKSLKKDDALLMLGRSYVQINRREEARRAFHRLIEEHPSSEYVVKAEELLNKI